MDFSDSGHIGRVGDDIVNSYLVVESGLVTIIDAAVPGYWKLLPGALAKMGRTLDDVRAIVLTHGDTDHIGFAERLRREQRIPVFVGRADAARARGEGKAAPPAWGRIRPPATLGFLAYAMRKGGLRTRYVGEVVEVDDGDILDAPGSPRVIALPGHSPGSIAVHVPIADAVFVGDALTTRHVLTGRTGGQPAPFTDEPERALDSLSRISDLEASWVLPGHGTPWHGSPRDLVAAVRTAAESTR
jgi:glyoxylase-like metal-dependent hydrolase (beta-lactamase superfamily II)